MDATSKSSRPSHRSVQYVKARLVSLWRASPYKPAKGWSDPAIEGVCRAILRVGLSERNLPFAVAAGALAAERRPDTVRGIMYALVSCGALPDTGPKSYGRIQRLLNLLRRREAIPFPWIVDNIRSTEKPSSWSGLSDFSETVQRAYRKNFWATLPEYVCIIVEKDTVAGRILPVTREYDVPLHPLRGFASTSYAFGIAAEWKKIKKPINAYYIGDHDPSGRDIERSIRERLAEYSGREFAWRRLAVEPDQFDEYAIIPLAPKKKDTRYARFVDEFGPRCAEVEAIPAGALRTMVRDAIQSHIPQAEWMRLQAIEKMERESFGEVMQNFRQRLAG